MPTKTITSTIQIPAQQVWTPFGMHVVPGYAQQVTVTFTVDASGLPIDVVAVQLGATTAAAGPL